MKKIVIASRNPVKIQAARSGFEKMFPGERFLIESASVPSGVSDQPRCSAETLRGALNRSENARRAVPDAHYWIGMEGGIEEDQGEMSAFAWIVVRSRNLTGKSRTGTFYLPEKVAQLIREGRELGEANDLIFQRRNSKQSEGAIGILSAGIINRPELYEQAVLLALLPFKNVPLYSRSG